MRESLNEEPDWKARAAGRKDWSRVRMVIVIDNTEKNKEDTSNMI